jgi:hypothetical protein
MLYIFRTALLVMTPSNDRLGISQSLTAVTAKKVFVGDDGSAARWIANDKAVYFMPRNAG